MSEGDVSLIRDEDVLRRMWQQTEDFSRKKEIRAHMYRLREERLRKLYSPEPTIDGKGCEFSSTQGHLRSFADQNFQSMKSKEVRDAASPPKDFVYRGQDLKELSNAGWNVESENRTTDDGHTHVRSVQANIEGNYDVEGGRGQFGAIDQHKQSVTEYKDEHSSLKKKEIASHTAAHEQVMQRTDDGTQISSTTSSSRSTSKFHQVSSTKHESVPHVTNNNDNDISQQTCNTNNNVEKTTRYTKTSDYDQTVKKSDYEQAELIARKVEYPDDNTKVVVETRCLPDGTRVTSTRREFRAPVVQTSQSEEYSKDLRRENKTFTSSTEKHSDVKQTSTKTSNITIDEHNQDTKDSFKCNKSNLNEKYPIDPRTHGNHPQKTVDHQNPKRSHHFDQKTYDIVDSQRLVDVTDFKRCPQDDNASDITTNTYTIKDEEIINAQVDKTSLLKNNFSSNTEKNTFQSHKSELNTKDQQQNITSSNEKMTALSFHDKTINDVNLITKINNNREKSKNQIEITRITTKNNSSEEIIEKKTTSDQYQNNYTQRKISTDWSPSHQAWASTLRADTPPKENISTRASSPGSRTIQSSTSSLRSSVSPEKSLRKPGSRGTSPTKTVRTSPSRTINRCTSPDKKYPHGTSPSRAKKTPDNTRSSVSPDQHIQEYRPGITRPSQSPERKPRAHFSRVCPDEKPPSGKSSETSPPRANYSPEKQAEEKSPTMSGSPEKTPGYMRPTASQSPSSPRTSPIRSDTRSPDRQTMKTSVLSKTEENHNRFVDEEIKVNKKTTGYIPPAASQTPSRPQTSPTRSDTRSPDRHTVKSSMPSKTEKDHDRSPTNSQTPRSPRTSPTRSDTRSPDRHTVKTSMLSKTEEDYNRFVDEETKVYKKTPGYVPPSASQTPNRPRTSPTRSDARSPDRHTMETSMPSKTEKDHDRSPTNSQTPRSPRTFPTRSDTRSPDRHTVKTSMLSKTEEDYNRFVDEETKVYKKTPGYVPPSASQTPNRPRTSPTRSDARSPDRHTMETSILSKTEKDHNRLLDEEKNVYKKSPGYMRPTASQISSSPRTSPIRSDNRSPDRHTVKTSMPSKTEKDHDRSPTNSQTPRSPRTSPTRSDTRSPDRHTVKTSMLSKTEENHNRFVDEEIKVNKKTTGYIPPAASQTPSRPQTSPTRSDTRSPDRHTVKSSMPSKTKKDHDRSPTNSQTPRSPRTSPTRSDTRSPDRHTVKTSMLSKTEEDYNRFVDEETKVYKKTPGYVPPSASQTPNRPRTSPTRSDARSPDRHTMETSILSKTEKDHNRLLDEEKNVYKKSPGYMRPTASQISSSPRTSPIRSDNRSPDRHTMKTSMPSKTEKDHDRSPTNSQTPRSPRTSPTRSDTRSPDRHTVMKTSMLSKTEKDHNRSHTTSQSPSRPRSSPTRSDTRSPDRHTLKTSMLSKTEKNHKRFVDEETKNYKKAPECMRPTASQTKSSPRTSPTRSDTRSPDRHTNEISMLSKTEKDNNRLLDEEETNFYKKTPGYMRPTASQTRSSPRTSPTRSDTRSPDRHTLETSMLLNTDVDHNRFVDEEMEIYKQSDNYYTSRKDSYHNTNNFSKYSPLKDTPDSPKPSNLKTERSPSPPKGPVTFISQQENQLQTRKKDSEHINVTNVIKGHDKPKYEHSPEKFGSPSRDRSPSTYETYDKEERKYNTVKKETSTRVEDFKVKERDTSIRREKSPTKFSHPTDSSTKKPPKETSPVKSPTKSIHTSDFINNEKKIEEINKRTTRPRQLITPSTSPTRKPTTAEKAPSTGQSSPTTSVTGFEYFHSPRQDDKPCNYNADLNPDWYLESKTNDSITTNYNNEKELTSTLPCKSSKLKSPTKESLPRKSSLKKPSENVIHLISPIEKPPTNFRVSPIEPEHHVVKKDQPELPSEVKPKPPLERRETYEERCRKILGMTEDEKTLNNISHDTEKYTNVQKHSPGISPRGSPDFNEVLSPSVYSSKLTNKEPHKPREEIRITTQKQEKQNIVSRDNSPTKLQDILSRPKHDAKVENIGIETINTSQDTSKTESIKRSPLSPVRKLREPSPIKLSEGTGKESPDFEDNALPSTKTSKSDFLYKLQENNYKDEVSSQSHTSKSVTTTKTYDTTPYKADQPGDIHKRTPSRSPSPIKSASKYQKEKPQVPGHSRTPSPIKNVTKVVNISSKEHQYIKQGDEKESHEIQKDVKPSRKSEHTLPLRTPSPTTTIHKVIENTAGEKQYSRKEIIIQSENKYSNSDINIKSEKQVSVHSTSPSTDIKTNNKFKKEHKDYDTRRVPYDKYVKSERSIPSRSPSPRKSNENIDNNTKQIPSSPQKKRTEPLQRRSPSPIKSMTSTATTRESNISKQKKLIQKPTTLTESGKTNKPRALSQTTPLKPPSKVEKVKKIKSRSPSPEKNISKIQIQPPSQYQNTCYPVKPYDTNTMKRKETNESKIMKYNTEFIKMEKDQEALNKMQTHSREVSSDRSESSSIDEVLSDVLDDLENSTVHKIKNIDVSKGQLQTSYTNNSIESDDTNTKILIEERPRDKPLSKLPSRNISPTKNITTIINKTAKSPEPTKPRSLSPKKATLPIQRPQSPQVPKPGTPKIKQTTLTRKTISQSKVDKILMSEDRKTSDQQNSIIKISTNKNIRSPNKPLLKEHAKKETEIRTSRTTSDISKRPISLKTRSKPEIQVSDVTSKFSKKPTKMTRTTLREPQTKLATKPKSATALNTSIDENDVIVDVQQAKSSRENSPDRICPTPVNVQDDVSTPRFPDEVSEPDDEFRRRTNHIIHETETIVDDIVEISEDDELFVKRYTKDENGSDERFSNETDNVATLTNKINTIAKPSPHIADERSAQIQKILHTDFITDDLKSDECLLSVSEKVSKFAKGPYDKRDVKSPSRKIFDEYDKNTVYQDDYTKLSVNDKAHLFIETAEKAKAAKIKPTQKAERPDLSNVDETLKTDNCLLSVSDKVNKFVKSAELVFTDSQELTEKEKKIKEKHEIIMKSIIQDSENEFSETENECYMPKDNSANKSEKQLDDKVTRTEIKLASPLKRDHCSPKYETNAKTTSVKITTLRSSEAVKKAKALFENISSTTQKSKDDRHKITKLTDIGVVKKLPPADSTIVHHPLAEDGVTEITDIDSEVDFSHSLVSENYSSTRSSKRYSSKTLTPSDKRRNSPPRSISQTSETPSGTPSQCIKTTSTTSTKTVLSRYPHAQRPGTQKQTQLPTEKSAQPQDIVPGYLKPTKTSQIREEIQQEETEVSSRRGSEKFGIELRRTSADRTSVSSERRHSVEHHQPCIEDIFDVDLLERMLEKVVGYEQRRRIRTQIRVAKKKCENEQRDGTTGQTIKNTYIKTPKNRSPERQPKSTPQKTLSPERLAKSKLQNTRSPERHPPKDEGQPVTNGHAKEPTKSANKLPRPQSPEKRANSISKTKSPIRHTSPEKKSFSSTPKIKTNRFDEYASAYIKKVGLYESDNHRLASDKIQMSSVIDDKNIKREITEHKISEIESLVLSKTRTDRSSSKDFTEVIQRNGKRSPSPDKRISPERRAEISTEKKRSPSPDHKRPTDHKKETTIKTSYDVGKQTQPKQVLEEKPSWVTNRNLKKITSDTRTASSKKIESEKPKYRASSPSKVISKPIDVITSSYGPGPLDADGRPLFGIKALRKGATNFQVKGTVIRQEYHSTNGGEPEGTVSVTAYSSQPEELERLLAVQGERPSRLHGLAAITTTKKFGGTTGATLSEVHSKEDSATLQQFTQSDRRVTGSRVEEITECRRDSHVQSEVSDNTSNRQSIDKSSVRTERGQKRPVQSREEDVTKMEKRIDKREQNVRQSSVKSLTEKFIKNASESTRSERSTYPKAGLILRSTSKRDSVSSDSSAHAGLTRADSEQSLASDGEESTVVTTTQDADGRRVTTRTTTRHHTHTQGSTQERSFLDSTTKVTGVQDILTRMKNADIVIEKGDSTEDAEARALLNKFLGASVLMAGMRNYVVEPPVRNVSANKESVSSCGKTHTQRSAQELDLDQCWDERLLKKLLEESTDYEQRRLLRVRIRTLMAEQEVSEAATCAEEQQEQRTGESPTADSGDADVREEEEITVTSSVRRNSSEKTVSSSTTTKTSKVIESVRTAPKPVSPFTKFRQLEKQNSTNSPKSPTSPQPASPGSRAPLFRFTEPALQASAATIKERLLQWCRDKTRDYENVKLENFSTSWADGLAFCALVHHFVPDAFDYSKLTPDKRRHNFTLAFKVADEKAGIYPLLDVEDMVETRRPDWKCVFTYVQAIHRRFRDQP